MATTDVQSEAELRRVRNAKAAALLRKWMTEDPEYDQRVGDLLEQELKHDGVRCGETNDPGA